MCRKTKSQQQQCPCIHTISFAKLFLNLEFRRSIWRKDCARLFSSWRQATKAISSANCTCIEVSKVQVDAISLVYTENNTGERTYPCGAPVFTISSSDNFPLRLTLCGRSHRNCLTQRTMVWLVSRSRSLLIRRWGWIVLKTDEQSMNSTRTYDPDLSRWLAMKFTSQTCIFNTPPDFVRKL